MLNHTMVKQNQTGSVTKKGSTMYNKIIPVILISASALFSQVYQPQTSAMKYSESHALFREIMTVGAFMVNTAQKNDLEVVKIDIDLVGKSNPKKTLKVFSKEYRYVITVAGQPSRIIDTDLRVYYLPPQGGDAILVAKDEKVDYLAAIEFSPPANGTYMIVTDAYEMKNGYESSMGYYFMIVAHN